MGGGAGVHQPTAQLTLFYAGLVHVYDDITLDKVRIMQILLVCAFCVAGQVSFLLYGFNALELGLNFLSICQFADASYYVVS